MRANPERASTPPLGPLQRHISTAVGSVVKRCWSMKRSLRWWLARPSFVVSIGAACLRLTAQDVTVRPWSTSSKSNSPPKGRLLDMLRRKASLSCQRRCPNPATNLHGILTLYGLLTAFEKNGHAICPGIEAPQDDISLRQTRIGWPCSLRSIAQSPSTISPRTRRFAADNPAVLTQ